MYAVIRSGGKQYCVSEGESVKLEKLDAEVGEKVRFDDVLWVQDEDSIKVGTSTVKGAKVTGKVTELGKAGKILVFKFKRRKMYRRKQGHRQAFSQVHIDKIVLPKAKARPQPSSEAEPKAAVKTKKPARKAAPTAAKPKRQAKTRAAAEKKWSREIDYGAQEGIGEF